MKIVGVMVVRNEEWVLGLSLRAALKWVDVMVVLNNGSLDASQAIIDEVKLEQPERIVCLYSSAEGYWDEMVDRQRTLEAAREAGATHIAIIDADEVLTGNLLVHMRGYLDQLAEKQLLDLPMIAPWRGLEVFRDDQSVWSRSRITVAFRDHSDLCWHNREAGYAHHHRPPHGAWEHRRNPVPDKSCGGVMHLQWVNWDRLKAKHAWYKIQERIRWPDLSRSSVTALNKTYGQALNEEGMKTSVMKNKWTAPYEEWLDHLSLEGESWHAEEARDMIQNDDGSLLDGLDLFGVIK